MMYWCESYVFAYVWAKIGFIGVIFIPVTMFHFVTTFLDHKYKKYIPKLYYSAVPIRLKRQY